MLNKAEWLKTCRMTAKASGKPHLSKKERIDLMQAQIAIGGFKVQQKPTQSNWQPFQKDKPVDSIATILSRITRS